MDENSLFLFYIFQPYMAIMKEELYVIVEEITEVRIQQYASYVLLLTARYSQSIVNYASGKGTLSCCF